MPLVLADRVRETTTTTGTGTVTLGGAVTGFQTFAAIGNGNTTYYAIAGQGTSEWEVGIGTYTAAGTTLSRDTVLASSNAGALVSFSAGVKDVFCDYPAGRAVYLDTATNTTLPNATLTSDLRFSGTGNRITGDFTNGTIASRVMFQTSTANSTTVVSAIPSGTGTQANFNVHNSSDPNNASDLRLIVNATEARIQASNTGTGTALPLTVYTGGSERMRVTTAGNVGIGTTLPGYRLTSYVNSTAADVDVAQVVSEANPTGTSITHLRLEKGGGYGGSIGGYITQGVGAGLVLSTLDSGVRTNQMWVTGAGNVGIGTSNPSGDGGFFVVRKDQNASTISRVMNSSTGASVTARRDWTTGTANSYAIAQLADASGSPFWQLSVGPAVTSGYFDMPVHIWRSQAASEWMRLNSTGLGIGTSSPNGKLDVTGTSGSVRINATGDQLEFTRNGYNYVTASGAAATLQLQASGASGVVTLGTTGAERVRVTSAGDVGIGTVSPGYKLDVSGTANATTVRASNGIVVNSATISANYTIASGDNGLSAGPVTVASGVAVTVSSGSVWTVV